MSYLDELWMGPGTFRVDPKMYKLNRTRLLERLRKKKLSNALVLLQGGSKIHLYGTDETIYFKQESFFQWAFGILEPDCYGAINIQTGLSYGFFPKPPTFSDFLSGPSRSLSYFLGKYELDDAYYTDDIAEALKKFNFPTLLVLKGINTDSGNPVLQADFEGINCFNVNTDILFHEMSFLKSIKTSYELDLLRYIIKTTSGAHRAVMKFVAPGKFQNQCQAMYVTYTQATMGSINLNYHPIICTGTTCSTLHYIDADQAIEDGEMCLFDFGCAYLGYTADITCSFPANGKFTEDQKIIYEAVLDAFNAVLAAAKPGIAWDCMHSLANKVMMKKLLAAGLLKGDIKEILEADVAYIFQPHGLGHLMGMHVHELGGYLKGFPERPKKKALKYLRTSRVLEEGIVITVEPGCYFVEYILQKGFEDANVNKFLVKDVIDRFKPIGGVRIEGNIVITATGNEVMEDVPRTVVEIEKWMSKDKK